MDPVFKETLNMVVVALVALVAAPLRLAPDMPRMQLSPLPLPGRLQRPQYLEQIAPTPLQTEEWLLMNDDASDPLPPATTRRRRRSASTEPDEAATVDLWTYQAPGGAAAWSKRSTREGHPLAHGYFPGPRRLDAEERLRRHSGRPRSWPCLT